MPFQNDILAGASGSQGSAYTIDQSCRFDANDNQGLIRTVHTAGNRKTWTISFWFKLGDDLGAHRMPFVVNNSATTSDYMFIEVSDDPQILIEERINNSSQWSIKSADFIRDPAAWYHIVFKFDTTPATPGANDITLYINGEVATLASASYPSQNFESYVNKAGNYPTTLGQDREENRYEMDGYLAEFYLIDGLALAASNFGELDTTINQWVPKDASGDLTFGTNGFYQKFGNINDVTSFTDSGATGHTLTNNGAVYHSRRQKKIGNSGILWGDQILNTCLSAADHGDWSLGTTWTIEAWWYVTAPDVNSAGNLNSMIAGQYNGDGSNWSVSVYGFGSSGAIAFFNTNWASYFKAENVGLTVDTWHHIAVVKSGGSNYVFVDGVSQTIDASSGSPTIGNISARLTVGAGDHAGVPGAYVMNGYMDEVRISNTARWTAGFTPSTTAYVSDANTKLLIHSNITVADGWGLGEDSSGNENDLCPMNFTSSDKLLDNPTNNFPTYNPLCKITEATNNGTLSQGNLKSTPSGSHAWPGTIAVDSGKFYWEVLWTASTTTGGRYMVIFDAGNNLEWNAGPDIGWGTGRYGVVYDGNIGDIYNSGTGNITQNGLATLTDGDIIAAALNLDASPATVQFYKNNATIGTAENLNASASGIWGFATNSNTNWTWYLNAGADSSFSGQKTAQGNEDGNGKGDFYYSPPAGYLAMCTNNLADPSIKLPGENFNTVLYTGNGSTQSITGVGFQPDIVWIKDRTAAESPHLYDAVRGATETLLTNQTQAEFTGADRLTAFDSDGFSLGNNDGVNKNTDNIVSWNWKTTGGAAVAKTYAVTVAASKLVIGGFSQVTVNMREGSTYTFDTSDSSVSGHTFKFATAADAAGSTEYTTGVTETGTPGNAGAKTVIVVAGSAPQLYYYCSNHSSMGGTANTNITAGSSNFDGTVASTVSANTTAGFSIVSYTGNSASAQTIGHGLSVAPELIIIKNLTDTVFWPAGTIIDAGWNYYLNFDSTEQQQDNDYFNDTAPTASVFSVNTNNAVNGNTNELIAYCFQSVKGFSQISSYKGNGVTANYGGTFIYTGFRPAYILLKCTDTGSTNWMIFDDKRIAYNPENYRLMSNDNLAEHTTDYIDILSNGFKLITTHSDVGTNDDTYLYYAVAKSPFKYATAR